MLAEVIASNTRFFRAELGKEEMPPAIGTWLQCAMPEGGAILGVVSQVEQGSIEPNRQTVALGKTREELQMEFPQIAVLLRTTVDVLVLACITETGNVIQGLPPRPARLHEFVLECAPEVLKKIGAPFDFLRILISYAESSIPVDDMVVNMLRHIRAAYPQPEEGRAQLVQAGRVLGRLLRDDHERLQSILRRVEG